MGVFMMLLLSSFTAEPDVSVVTLAFSDDSKQLVSGHYTGDIRLWDVPTKKEIAKADVKAGDYVSSVAFAGDQILAATIGFPQKELQPQEHGQTLLLDRRLQKVKAMPGHHIAVHRNGVFFVSEGEAAQENWKVLRLKDNKAEVILGSLPGRIASMAISANGELLATGMGREVCLYHFPTGRFQALEVEFRGSYNCLAFAGPDLLLLQFNGQLSRWSADGKLQQKLPTYKGTCVTANQEEVYVGTVFGDIEVWSLKTGKQQKVLHPHQGPVYAIALSPNGKWMASGGYDGQVVFHAR
jgi:WD40 repeat protein